jgi:hypothetical protein
VKKPRKQNSRAELYQAFDDFGEILDHDLEPNELIDLEARLQYVIETAESDDFVRLARELLDFLTSDSVQLSPELPSLVERLSTGWRNFEERWLDHRRSRAILAGGLLALALIALFNLGQEILNTDFPGFPTGSIGDWLRLKEARDLLWLIGSASRRLEICCGCFRD